MTIAVLNEEQIIAKINGLQNPFFDQYYAFYSSWFGGITTDPKWMLLPIDDHMVHRGDGVFEAMKALDRAVYLLDEHLDRLFASAERISIKSPVSRQQMKETILQTLRVANHDDAVIRLFLARGPGGFTVNPYDSIAAQLYIVITHLRIPTQEKYERGVSIGMTNIPTKSSWMAQVKSCNYLPNVLMKKEAVDRQLDYVIAMNSDQSITESATENVMIVDKQGTIVHPPLDYILKGTTMVRTCELAREQGIATAQKIITLADMQQAREVMITGTSLNVLPVVKLENQTIGDGKPGELSKRLNELMINDIKSGKCSTTF